MWPGISIPGKQQEQMYAQCLESCPFRKIMILLTFFISRNDATAPRKIKTRAFRLSTLACRLSILKVKS
jgi:hypothetical protein